jgi:hypothetical protein
MIISYLNYTYYLCFLKLNLFNKFFLYPHDAFLKEYYNHYLIYSQFYPLMYYLNIENYFKDKIIHL